MNRKTLGVIALTALAGTVLWIVLLAVWMANAGAQDTFDQVLAYVSRLDALFYLTYLNAAFLVTIPAIAFMAGLYDYNKTQTPGWMRLGAVFIPIYGVLNLFSYLSQVTVVPHLVELRRGPGYQAACDVLLRLTIQQWPHSAVAFFNLLAYAILGIPSIAFGVALWRHPRPCKAGGTLLALNGIACILGLVGVLTRTSVLSNSAFVGGVLYLLALIVLSRYFLSGAAGPVDRNSATTNGQKS